MTESLVRISTPKVFQPLWMSRKRFNGAWGGRGSGKSHDTAGNLVKKLLDEPDEIAACVREIQGSIKDSVHKLVADKIRAMNAGAYFQVLEHEIRRHDGTGGFIFKGMKDQNADSIKSLEGVKFCWWEEAQNASDHALKLLRPTIRKEGSQFFFTWNPRFAHDAVDVLMRKTLSDDEKCVVKANWYDNPFFTDELEMERQVDLRGDEDNYLWVWDGEYQAQSDMQFIAGRDIRKAAQREVYTDLSDVLVMGVDVARYGDDKSVIWFRRGMDAKSMPPIVKHKINTMQLAGLVAELEQEHSPDAIFVDETGIGAGVVDRLQQLGTHGVIGVNFGNSADRVVEGLPKCRNKRSEMWAMMRMAIGSGLCIPDDEELKMELQSPLYQYDEKNAIKLEPKKDMKKRLGRSPDRADALALTFAYPVVARRVLQMHNVKMAQAKPYNPYE